LVHTQILETGTSDSGVEVNTLKQGVNLNGRLCRGGQCSLGPYTMGAKTTQCTIVSSKVLSTVLALKVLHTEIDNAVVEILAT